MALPAAWKVRRELRRTIDKLVHATARITYEPLRKSAYDFASPLLQRATNGAMPLTDRVAIFVVFQPKGLAPSILLTLDHLRQNGFSVIVVSNGRLRPADRELACRHAALVLERPNVGYDFGAYRDGIRYLWALRHDMSRLVLMNDSTWFPLRREDDSLARMEALEVDLAGHIYRIEDAKARSRDHVESHLLMISHGFLKSEEFRRFWSGYRMSDFRATTIEAGEKGFSQMALLEGRTVATLMSREWLVATLQGLDDPALRSVLDQTIDRFHGRQRNADDIRRAAARGEAWREQFLAWIDTALSNSRTFLVSATFVMPALVYGGMGFAKKANDIRFHLARQMVLELADSGAIPPLDPVIRAEIVQAVRTWVPPRGQELTAPVETAAQMGQVAKTR